MVCAEEEAPTAANLNLYRGWHGDDEPLFGKCADAKLIVSVRLGSSVVFRWRRQPCPDDEGHLCCLGLGDILVMDGQCQDEFLQRTDPGREQDRINITFRWIKQHASSCPLFKAGVACWFANVCAGFISSCYGECWCHVHMESASFASLPVVYKAWVTSVCLLLDRPFVGGRWRHYLCNLWGEYLKIHKTACQRFGIYVGFSFSGAVYASLSGTAQSPWL